MVRGLGIALTASLFVSAADTDLTLQENWKLANIKKGCEAKFQKNEDGSLTLTTNSPVCYLTHRLQFNKEKMLRIEGTIESSDTYMAKLYFNDSSGRLIYTDQFHIVPETGTELAEATTGNETLLKVKDSVIFFSFNELIGALEPKRLPQSARQFANQ